MNSGKEPSRPFHERPAFKGTVAVVALFGAVLALVGPLRSIVSDLFPDSPPPVSWVQVVLDTSAAMNEEFDGQTRLAAATQAIAKAVKELENEGLGLRRTAATCLGHSEQLVELDSGHADDVAVEAQGQRAQGKSSIVDAIVGGLQEFKREPIARGGPDSRRLLVYTAGVSQCSEENLGEEMASELKLANISEASEVELISLQPPEAQTEGEGADEEAEAEESGLTALSDSLDEHGVRVRVSTPENLQQLRQVSAEFGVRASRSGEILEEERENGFYEQE